MIVISSLFFTSLMFFSLTYLFYFVYVRHHVKKPWDVTIDKKFEPFVSILVPVYNEQKKIERKLENIQNVNYPGQKIEVIVVDDASDDDTLLKVEIFVKNHPESKIRIFKQEVRGGKAVALNAALPTTTAPIVIVTDADTFWRPDVLGVALPYLADPQVGAITGRGINENITESWVTKSEDNYLQLVSSIRLGESKKYSTIRFEGGFCAYKKEAFAKFDHESGSDDSGTALEIVQKGYRTIFVPDAVFYTAFPTSLFGKMAIKVRRANHLISLWVKCAKLILNKSLVLPKRIAIPEILLFIVNPFVFLTALIAAVAIVFLSPLSVLSLSILLLALGSLIFARNLFIEIIIDNFLLVYACFGYFSGKRFISWKTTGT